MLRKIDAEHIAAAMKELPSEYRVVTALYFMDEFSYREIADIIDCPVGTVRSRLHRGRKILQKLLWRVAREQGIVSKQLKTQRLKKNDRPNDLRRNIQAA